VVELDRDMVARLEAEFPPDRLTIHRADALGFPFGDLGAGPARGGQPALQHFLAPAVPSGRIRAAASGTWCFMLQKEVVDRMAAAPATPDYGRLSVMLQARFRVDKLFTVPPGAFRPPPKVDSAIVRLVPLARRRCPIAIIAVFAEVVARAFGQRRKTLRNTLKGLVDEALFAELGIDPGRRGETLSVAEFAELANRLLGIQDGAAG
jgi:16S rRNA (adenine1518-N6/adenine1519-N6)-dimethyltransferase